MLVYFNVVNKYYQRKSRAMYKFFPNKSFDQLLDILYFIFLKMFTSEFSYIEAWFIDQCCYPLEVEDQINITLVIY